tara:strand:+ start:539 stop:787 length:249 start_codon:yes stop_codon:yes gene_type:complete
MSDFTFLCSNCDAPLAEFLEKPKQSQISRKIKAMCPHCGDASFTKDITSEFYIGATEYTAVESLEEKDGVIIIKTIKSKKYD